MKSDKSLFVGTWGPNNITERLVRERRIGIRVCLLRILSSVSLHECDNSVSYSQEKSFRTLPKGKISRIFAMFS